MVAVTDRDGSTTRETITISNPAAFLLALEASRALRPGEAIYASFSALGLDGAAFTAGKRGKALNVRLEWSMPMKMANATSESIIYFYPCCRIW